MQKVAIVGCGLVAVKKHLPAFLRIKDKATVAAICDMNRELAEKAASRFGIRKVYTEFLEMLSREKPDIVDICTPPPTHAKLTVDAIGKGCHVLLEKPMALTLADCDAMIEAASKEQKEIGIVHNQVFNPAFTRAKALVSEGGIGAFLGMRIFLSTPADYMTSIEGHWAHRLPGGVLGETGPHAVYLALSFLKNVSRVEIAAKKMLPEYPWSFFEDYRMVLAAENGVASVCLIYGSDQWAAEIDIIGTTGTLRVDLQAQSVVRCRRAGLGAFSLGRSVLETIPQYAGSLVSNAVKYVSGRWEDAHTIGIRAFVESIASGTPPPVTAADGRETVRLMELAVEALQHRRA